MDFGEGGVGSGAHFNCGFMMSTERRELCLILFPTFYSPSISIGLSFSLPSPLSPAPSVPPLCSLIVCSLSLSLSHSWRLSLLSSHSSCCCCVRGDREDALEEQVVFLPPDHTSPLLSSRVGVSICSSLAGCCCSEEGLG